jgi:hypothetical protein
MELIDRVAEERRSEAVAREAAVGSVMRRLGINEVAECFKTKEGRLGKTVMGCVSDDRHLAWIALGCAEPIQVMNLMVALSGQETVLPRAF